MGNDVKEKIEIVTNQAMKDGLFSVCVVGIVHPSGDRIILPYGKFTYENEEKEINKDTIFDVASITKSIPTSSLALKLIDEGKLNVDDQLIKYIPEISNSHREKILIKHLLTQTLDFGFRLSDYKDKTPDEILKVIFATEFKSSPGDKYYYSNATSILLGIVIQRIFNAPLDELSDKYFFEPLKMTRTTFNPLNKFKKEEIIPTEIQEWRNGLIHGEVHDESSYILQQNGVVGSAGLFSTISNLLNFLEMLLNNGKLNGEIYFSAEIMKQIQTNQLSNMERWAGLGWELNQPQYMGKNCTKKTFGKTGFTGSSVVCDITQKIGFAILSNYTYPTRKKDANLINKFRSDIADIIFEKYSPDN